jgi:hypothetical protein
LWVFDVLYVAGCDFFKICALDLEIEIQDNLAEVLDKFEFSSRLVHVSQNRHENDHEKTLQHARKKRSTLNAFEKF